MAETQSTPAFDYMSAFQRNIGLVTEEEQQKLREFTVVIPGMGAVGSLHLISLVRQGFEKFKIADFDTYDLKNLNRQYGARMDTIGRPKAEVMKEEALKINPNCQIEIFENGVTEDNIEDFVSGADLGVDAIDAFTVEARRLFINTALAHDIPVISAGPIGFSTAFLIFKPDGPNFDDYFAVQKDTPYWNKIFAFFVGLVPKMLQRPYMKKTDVKEKRGPSSIGSINLCGGVVVVYALKLLLERGKVRAIPYYHQFDPMREKYVTKRLWFMNKNPIQQIKMKVLEKMTTD